MRARLVSAETVGLVLQRRLGRRSLTASWGEILSAERLASGRGFRLHLRSAERVVLVTGRKSWRTAERSLRDAGVIVVDEFGARIDESQFDKEADPSFNRKVGPGFAGSLWDAFAPNWYLAWRYRRDMRQSSDNA